MADKSLQALTSTLVRMSNETHDHIYPDVEKIRETLCGSIVESLVNIDKNIDSFLGSKKGDLSKIGAEKAASTLKPDHQKKLLKSTTSIESILGKILAQIEKANEKGFGGVSSSKERNIKDLSSKNMKDFKDIPEMSRAINLAARLKSIKLKDLRGAGRKIKKLKNILEKFRKLFVKFKDNEEAQQTISFAESTIGMMKSLAKVATFSKLAKKGAKAIEKILLGNKRRKGLLAVLREMGEKDDIKKGIEAAKMLKAACTSLFIATLMLVGIAVVGIPAMLGALILRGVIWLLTKTFKLLAKATKSVLKGSLVLLIMSTSVILFALGLGLMAKAVRKMEWKDVGIMLASIVGLGLAVAGIGLLSIPIAIGSMVLLMIGVSLGLFAVTMLIWRKLDVKEAMGNIKLAVEGLREVFGLELGKGDDKKSFGARLGGGLMDLAMAILNFGKSFFIMGSILLAGAALGILYIGLKNWQNFHGAKEAVANMKIAISGLREVFGLEEPDRDEGFGSKLKKLGGGIIDLAVTILQAGSALVQIGVLTLATGLSVLIRESLKGWANFNAKDAIGNLKTAISGLRDIFGLEEPDRDEGFGSKLKKLGGGIIDLAVTILQAGSALVQIGILTLATGLSVLIRESLKGWSAFDPKPAIINLKTAMSGLREIFGLSEPDKDEGIGSKLKNIGGGILDLAIAIIQAGATLIQLGVLSFAIGVSALIRESLKKWQDFNPTPAIANLKTAMNGLKKIFGLETPQNPLEKVGSFFGDLVDIGLLLVKMGKTLIVMGTLSMATGMSIKILHALREWEHANISRTAIVNMRDAISELKKVFGLDKEDKRGTWEKLKSLGGGLLDAGLTMMNSNKILREMGTITVATAMSVKIRESLESWKTYPDGATENLKKAIDKLKVVFGLDDDDIEKKKPTFGDVVGGMFELGMSMMKDQGVLYKLGTIAVGVGMMGKMREDLEGWESYKEEHAIENLEDATNRLLNLFGLGKLRKTQNEAKENLTRWQRFKKGAKNVLKSVFGGIKSDIESSLTKISMQPKLTKINAIATAVSLLEPMREALSKWEDFNPQNALNYIAKATGGTLGLMNAAVAQDKVVGKGFWLGRDVYASERFSYTAKELSKGISYLVEGLKKLQNVDTDDVKPLEKVVSTVNQLDITKTWYMTEFFKAFSKIGDSPITGFIKAVNKFADSCEDMVEALNRFEGTGTGEAVSEETGYNPSPVGSGSTGVNVNNSSGLAQELARALRAAPINVRTDISDIRLVVNNETGRRVVLTLDN